MTASDQIPAKPKPIARWLVALIGAVILIGIFTVIAVSPMPMRGAEVFGALANKIKGHPGATAFWVFTALGLLWCGIGIFAAVQEWLATRRKAQ